MTPRRAHFHAGLLVGIALASLACGKDSPPEPDASLAPTVLTSPAATEPPPPAEETIYEVTFASTPSGAAVLLSGAELGKTPYVLKYKRKTTVEVYADGYLPAEVTLDETSDPNIVVTLQPDPNAPAVISVTPCPDGKVAGKSGTLASSSPSGSHSGAAKSSPSADPTSPGAPKPTGAAKSTSGLPYPDVAAAKHDYQQGKIDRDAYDQAVRKLKVRRNDKIAVIRAKYQAGEFDKDEYNRRKRIIDNEYYGK